MKEEKQMSKNIADLYNEVMSHQAAEKTAADVSAAEGSSVSFDRDFFEKVASGDEEAVDALNAFIEEARAEGHSDEDIESAIGEAMADAGISDDEESADDFEAEKVAAYNEGAARALADVLDGDLAKTAGVTEQDLADYYLGVSHGLGYAETRSELESVVEKIASAKASGISEMASKAKNAITSAFREAASPRETYRAARAAADSAKMEGMQRAGHMAKALAPAAAVYGTGAAALGGAGYGAKKLMDKRKKQK
jgi:hypothetical protein